MKHLSIISVSLLMSVMLFYACTEQAKNVQTTDSEQISSTDFFNQNMSFFDARIKSIDDKTYVRELYLANFSSQPWGKDIVSFDEYIYNDNGEVNDLVANDGIFTSAEIFQHDARIPYNELKPMRSVMANPIVSPDFKMHDQLASLEQTYSVRENQVSERIFEVTCDVTVGGNCHGCNAENWGWCSNCCVCLSNCSVTVGF